MESRYKRYRDSYVKYRKENRDKLSGIKRRYDDENSFGGNREIVLSRDGYKCTICGMTNDEHLELFNRRITVHHIDGNGRNSDSKNHDLSNLETLCLKCHGRIDKIAGLKRRRK